MKSLDRHNEVQDEYWEEDVEAYNNDSLSLPTLRLVWISEHDKQVRGGPAPADPADCSLLPHVPHEPVRGSEGEALA